MREQCQLGAREPIDIAVVIPAYNAEAFIVDALDSIALQTRRPDEVIVVDDGSTDRTQAFVAAWRADNDLEVRLLGQVHAGLPAARNTGIAATRRSWIALLDADDVWCSDHLSSLESAVAHFPASILVFGDIYIFSGNAVSCEWFSREKAASHGLAMSSGSYSRLDAGLYESLVSGNYIVPSSLMFCREAAARAGFFDESLTVMEDGDFLLRLSRLGNFTYSGRMTVGCRDHAANLTHEKNALRNDYFAFHVLRKTLHNSPRLMLDAREEGMTRAKLSLAARNLIYSASSRGVVTYVNAWRTLLEAGMYKEAFNVKHFARALFSCLRKGVGRK